MNTLPSYLRAQRRKWALTQRELAQLLGNISPSAISKYETLARTPSPEVLHALELVFNASASELFPAFSHSVRRVVTVNAELLRADLASRTDAKSLKKRQLLDAFLTRSTHHHEE